MYIVHIASELAPIAKVGGLADVVYGLAKATAAEGHQVEIILPKYDSIRYPLLQNLQPHFRDLWSFDGPYPCHNTVWSAKSDGLNLLLLEPHHTNYLFGRGRIYGCNDDVDRFIYFSRACLEYLFKSGKKPDIIHLHDWPTALIAPLYKEMYIPLGFSAGGIVLTIHNMEHQGKCAPANISRAGLRGEEYLAAEKMQDPSHPLLINLLKGGIVYSDALTTVSPTYEKEVLSEGGSSLAPLLKKQKIKGILNGIDSNYWNSSSDPLLSYHFGSENFFRGKAVNKTELRKRLGMKESAGPLVAAIARLVPQKAPELIESALLHTLEKEGQFVLIGTSPIPEIDKHFRALQKQLSRNKNAAFFLEYDEALSHLAFAAADMVVIPSHFEPCGLTQMIALRYGAVPIARATGGLLDTVFDVDDPKVSQEKKNGFLFEAPTAEELSKTLDRAFAYFKNQGKWELLVAQGMKQDYSWAKSTSAYIDIYKKFSNPKMVLAI